VYAHDDCMPVSVNEACLMCEEDNNRYDRGNHGNDTNPETAHTKHATSDNYFYFLTLPYRQGHRATRLGASTR